MLSESKSRFAGNKIIHKADSMGYFDYGWLKTKHTFSFSNYYDPERVNFGMLRVLNDDFVEAGQGFGTHPHNDMEIVSIPLSGALAHKDSTGTEEVIDPNEVQVMSAGTGILHSEYNHSKDERNKLQYIVTPEKKDDNLWLNQDAYLSLIDLEKDKSLNYKIHTKGNGVYLFLIDGNITVGNESLSKRDGIGIWETDAFSITAEENSQVLLIEVPME